MRPLLTAILLTGCADKVSNGIFAEDLEFIEALPDADRATVQMDDEYTEGGSARADAAADEEGGCMDHWPYLLCLSWGIGTNVNSGVGELLYAVDYVRSFAPSERGADYRKWGPYEVDDDLWMQLDIEREGGLYTWQFTASNSQSGPWTAFYTGEHYEGVTISEGVGFFEVDYGAIADVSGADWQGLLEVDYDRQDDVELLVHYQDVQIDDMTDSITADYWYWGDGEQGDLEFRTDADWTDGGVDETLEIRTRWISQVGGRSDARLRGGDLEKYDDIQITQCWGRYGIGKYQWCNYDLDDLEEYGSESDCVFSDLADIEHI